MGRFEMMLKTEELRKRVRRGDYETALKILDTLDLKKVKNTADLSLMADIYTQNGRYDEALLLLQKIYTKTESKKALYSLIEISIKNNNISDAEDYLKVYEIKAPNDYTRYIFRYQIDKLKGASFETLIKTLEALKEIEYMEEWAYELAKLYYKTGMEEECVRECSDIILWFGEGSYVEKAKVLKAYFTGEANKETILEELKKRAKSVSTEDIQENNKE